MRFRWLVVLVVLSLLANLVFRFVRRRDRPAEIQLQSSSSSAVDKVKKVFGEFAEKAVTLGDFTNLHKKVRPKDARLESAGTSREEASFDVVALSPDDGSSYMFGYFDKQQVDDNNMRTIVCKIPFFNMEPLEDSIMTVGYVTLDGRRHFEVVGSTTAWNLQQGAMAEWVAPDSIVFNIRKSGSGGFGSRVVNVETLETYDSPRPVYAFNRATNSIASISFERLHNLRRGYGYTVPLVPPRDKFPSDDGIWLAKLRSSEERLIVSIGDVRSYILSTGETDYAYTGQAYATRPPQSENYFWWINHVMFSADGSELAFLVRAHHSAGTETYSFSTLMMYNIGSKALWRVPKVVGSHHFFQAFLLSCDGAGTFEIHFQQPVVQLPWQKGIDGHCSLSPRDGKWILTDTYPDQNGNKHLYIEETHGSAKYDLGFFKTMETGPIQTRCDLHPKWDTPGQHVLFDSTHGSRRAVYKISFLPNSGQHRQIPPYQREAWASDLFASVGWLHMPKTGTSFGNVFLRFACPRLPKDWALPDFGTNTYTEYIREFQRKHKEQCDRPFLLNLDGVHKPLPAVMTRRDVGRVFAFIRDPSKRTVSGFSHNFHDCKRMQEKHLKEFGCHENTLYCKFYESAQFETHQFDYLQEYSACVKDLLLTSLGSSGRNIKAGEDRIDELGFVGLTEHWNLSICLFHIMYGTPCYQSDLEVLRPGSTYSRHAPSQTVSWENYLQTSMRDSADSKLYQQADRRFRADVHKYGVTNEKCNQICPLTFRKDINHLTHDAVEQNALPGPNPKAMKEVNQEVMTQKDLTKLQEKGKLMDESLHDASTASPKESIKEAPAHTSTICLPLSITGARCGPGYGRCNTENGAFGQRLYCNTVNGWCGNTAAHRDAQEDDSYDWQPASCTVGGCAEDDGGIEQGCSNWREALSLNTVKDSKEACRLSCAQTAECTQFQYERVGKLCNLYKTCAPDTTQDQKERWKVFTCQAERKRPQQQPRQPQEEFALRAPPLQAKQVNPGVVVTLSPDDGSSYMFGYFDKHQVDDNNNRTIVCKIPFFNKEPLPDSKMTVGYVTLDGRRHFEAVGSTTAWNLQQGTMAEWVSPDSIVFNIRKSGSGGFGSRVVNVETLETYDSPRPVYAFNRATGSIASISFERLHNLRRGYGYTVPLIPPKDKFPNDDGIWLTKLRSPEEQLIVSIRDVRNYILSTGEADRGFTGQAYASSPPRSDKYYWWINHVMFSADGSELAFLVRAHHSAGTETYSFSTLMMYKIGSKALWRVPKVVGSHHFFQAFLLSCDGAGTFEIHFQKPVVQLPWQKGIDGHCSLSPRDGNWILTDTYPDQNGDKHLYIEETHGVVKYDLGSFKTMETGPIQTRCDLHPKWDTSGQYVLFDSTHGSRRAVYKIGFLPGGGQHRQIPPYQREAWVSDRFASVGWLHMPKTGTSFGNAFLRFACPRLPRSWSLPSFGTNTYTEYIREFQRKHKEQCDRPFLLKMDGVHKHLNAVMPRKDVGRIFAFIRDPSKRTVSGFAHNFHDCKRMQEKHLAGFGCHENTVYCKFYESDQFQRRQLEYLTEYSTCVKDFLLMYLGLSGGNLKAAEDRIDELGFVGLTEHWNLSICLFHIMFATPCYQSDLEVLRPGSTYSRHTPGQTADWEKHLRTSMMASADGKLYKKADQRFWADVRKYGATTDKCNVICPSLQYGANNTFV